MVTPNVFVLSGEGINCEPETIYAFTQLGAKVTQVHVSQFLSNPSQLENYQILVFPGGFSYGDELGSGQVLALKLNTKGKQAILKFYDRGGLILGICNGFQVLVKMGLLTSPTGPKTVTLAPNHPEGFIDKWVDLKVGQSHCIWTQELPSQIRLPIRHGEGRLVLDDKLITHEQFLKQGALFYTQDINGSLFQTAGLTDAKGQILGLMPHPEAAFFKDLDPMQRASCLNSQNLKREYGDGYLILKNGVNAFL